MKKSPPTTPSDTGTSEGIPSYVNLLGNWVDLLALPGSKRANEIESERDRYWEKFIVEQWRVDKRSALLGLYEAGAQLREQLALARLPKFHPGGSVKLEAITHSSKKADKAKAPMARIALDAWTAYDSAERDIEKLQWRAVLVSAIRIGCCIGRLADKNENVANRSGKVGKVKQCVRDAYQKWKDDDSKKRKYVKFDKEAAKDCCNELRTCNTDTLRNEISILKKEERRRAETAAFLRKHPLAEVE